MTDVLIRNVPEEDLRGIDENARRQGLSRSEYLRRRLHEAAEPTSQPITADDLRNLGDMFAGLGDEQLMRDAWS